MKTSTGGRGSADLITIASMSRHRPPKSSTWMAGSVKGARLVYCSGRLRPSTSAPAGAQRGPARRAIRPPKVSTASPPSTGAIPVAPTVPCAQNPPASSSGSPEVAAGTTEVPCAKNPMLEKPSAGCAPPKARSDCGMGSEPCSAIQYPACRYVPGSRSTMIDSECSTSCHAA
ncbi:MAG: hypothetical protein ABSD40_20935 [Streptosporangiaceae bacterium]